MASVQFDGGKHTTKQATSGHIPHDFRERDNYSNTDIDKSRTHLNQYFGCKTGDEARSKLKKRIAECDAMHPPKRIKQDRKTSIEIHIPAPREDLDDKKLREFFERSYAELENTFGKENVIYGVTHFDEVHKYLDPQDKKVHESRAGLHAVIIPFTDDMSFVSDDKKSGLNMNNFYKKNLPNIVNKKLDEVCNEVFGFDFQDGSKTANKQTVEQLKIGSARILKQKKELKKLKDIIEHDKDVVDDLKIEYDSYQLDLTDLKAREQALFDREQAFEEEKAKYYAETKKALEIKYKQKEDALNESVEDYKEQLEAENKKKLNAALKEQVDSVKQFKEWRCKERTEQADEVMQGSNSGFSRELPI